MREIAFKIYLVYLVSFFLHITARIPALGLIRFDLLLIMIITTCILFDGSKPGQSVIDQGKTSQRLKALIIYIVVTLPLVEWPGSALNTGASNFVKAVIFFYFTVSLITSDKKLKQLVYVILSCQVFRVLEPLYLNITEGYWGDRTYTGGGEFAARLSGAPTDIINPNELGFVIVTVIILVYFLLLKQGPLLVRALALIIIGVCAYTLILTASRSAFLALGLAGMMIFWSSKNKTMFIFVIGIGLVLTFTNLNDFQKDRYLSIFSSSSGSQNSATAEGRINGIVHGIQVVMNRPFVGHGLGTSKEANYNNSRGALLSHNLYLEVAVELGFIGLLIYLYFLNSILVNIIAMMKNLRTNLLELGFVRIFTPALHVWVVVTLAFSLAQYGLSIYVFYLLAGLSVVLQNSFNDVTVKLDT